MSLPAELTEQISDVEEVPVLTPSVVQAFPKEGSAAKPVVMEVATSAKAIVATAPNRRALKDFIPLVVICCSPCVLEGLG